MTSTGTPEVTFPRVPRPAVSVVMVTLDQLEWTRRALMALIENTEPCYEVIVIDNASGEKMRRFLQRRVTNAIVKLNGENLGFGMASNQGASLARGRYLVFLNSDALVHAGWLSPLLARLRDSRVGVAGPKLLNVDGSLQSAGALTSRTGSTLEYGFGKDPHRAEFNFPRAVDYVCGCCLVVRRSVFEETGGFHPAYGLVYFEDADLCFSLRARDLFTVYEPASTVTHVRGASGALRRHPELPLRNRAVFERRWRRVLRDRPCSPLGASSWSTIAARDAPASLRRLLICNALPSPPSGDVDLSVRLTIAVMGRPPDGAVQAWLRRGAEVAANEMPALLEARRFLYDEIVVEAPLRTQALATALARTQPQALQIMIEWAETFAAAEERLTLAPDGPESVN